MRNLRELALHVQDYMDAISAQVEVTFGFDVSDAHQSDTEARLAFIPGDPTRSVGQFAETFTDDALVFQHIDELWHCVVSAHDRSAPIDRALQYEATCALRDLLLSALNRSPFQVRVLKQDWIVKSKSFDHGNAIRVTGSVMQPIKHPVPVEQPVFPWTADVSFKESDGETDTETLVELLVDLPSVELVPED
jgi:hypothetical protein